MIRRYLSISPRDCSHWTTADVVVVLTTLRFVGPEITEEEEEVEEEGHNVFMSLPGEMGTQMSTHIFSALIFFLAQHVSSSLLSKLIVGLAAAAATDYIFPRKGSGREMF